MTVNVIYVLLLYRYTLKIKDPNFILNVLWHRSYLHTRWSISTCSGVSCWSGLSCSGLNSSVIYFYFMLLVNWSGPECKGQSSRLGLLLLALTIRCNSVGFLLKCPPCCSSTVSICFLFIYTAGIIWLLDFFYLYYLWSAGDFLAC